MDDKACPICKAINGYTWTVTGTVNSLAHPLYGEVWNKASGVNIHEHYGIPGPCRCHVDINIDMNGTLAKIRTLHDRIKKAAEEVSATQTPLKAHARRRLSDEEYENFVAKLHREGRISTKDFVGIMKRRKKRTSSV